MPRAVRLASAISVDTTSVFGSFVGQIRDHDSPSVCKAEQPSTRNMTLCTPPRSAASCCARWAKPKNCPAKPSKKIGETVKDVGGDDLIVNTIIRVVEKHERSIGYWKRNAVITESPVSKWKTCSPESLVFRVRK